MSLGLSHSLSRHKLKFSPDKVDTMIVQAIALLDDLDKELNTYAMRVKEWYGWHFPEMGRIVNDNLAYARVILSMGMRTSASIADLSDILPEEIEIAVKAAAEVSMGTEITTEDLDNIKALAEQVVSFTEYRQQLSSYLSARMAAIAPNLTVLVGDLVGARLIAHAGSLMNLAKSPASTIQILGAEKALFRALKTKHDTPKYGLIYHASLIGQATGKNKGKIARVLAAKAAIGIRVDALADWSAEGEGKGDLVTEEEKSALGLESRLKIERRLAGLEGRPLRSKGVAIGPNGVSSQPGKWEVKEARKYNPDADGLAGDEPAAVQPKLKTATSTSGDIKMMEEVKEAPKSTSEDGKTIEEAKDTVMEDDDDDDESDDEEEAGGEDADAKMEDVPAKAEAKAEAEADADAEVEATEGGNGVEEQEALPPTATDAAPMPTPKEQKAETKEDDQRSITISTVSADTPDSPDSPTQQELNWQSPILGNTKDAKKARKKERHARKLQLSEERSAKRALRNAKLARRLDRKERRIKRAEQISRRDDRDAEKVVAQARQAGLSVTRFKRKLERGEIKFEADGTAVAISKKDIKKARKAAEKKAAADGATATTNGHADTTKGEEDGDMGEKLEKKRKREEDGEEKAEKKKKKKRSKEV